MPHELARITIGAKQEGGACFAALRFQVLVKQRGLAHSWRGNQRQETSTGLRTIGKRGHSLAMLLTEIEETRVRRNSERFLSKLVIVEKHLRHPPWHASQHWHL